MMRAAWRISGSPAMVAVALVAGLPAAADAQLLPNHNIKRQRDSCVHEPPFNAHVRRDYFGYYPTCWSRFPAGWTCPCPNPELPNPAESFRTRPRDKPAPVEDPGMEPGADDPSAPGDMPADPNLPPMPNQGRSPFELDNPANPPTGTDAAPPPFRNPAPAPRRDGAEPTTPPETRAPAPTGLLDMPQLPSPTTRNEGGDDAIALPDEAMLASGAGTPAGSPVQANLGPLPTPRGLSSPADGEIPTTVAPYPAKAPARKGVLGGLFNLGNRRRR